MNNVPVFAGQILKEPDRVRGPELTEGIKRKVELEAGRKSGMEKSVDWIPRRSSPDSRPECGEACHLPDGMQF